MAALFDGFVAASPAGSHLIRVPMIDGAAPVHMIEHNAGICVRRCNM
jgi:hypothetical protein